VTQAARRYGLGGGAREYTKYTRAGGHGNARTARERYWGSGCTARGREAVTPASMARASWRRRRAGKEWPVRRHLMTHIAEYGLAPARSAGQACWRACATAA